MMGVSEYIQAFGCPRVFSAFWSKKKALRKGLQKDVKVAVLVKLSSFLTVGGLDVASCGIVGFHPGPRNVELLVIIYQVFHLRHPEFEET